MSPLRGFAVESCRLPRACARGFTISAPPGRFEKHHDSSGFGTCSLRRVSEKTLKSLISRSQFRAKTTKLELKDRRVNPRLGEVHAASLCTAGVVAVKQRQIDVSLVSDPDRLISIRIPKELMEATLKRTCESFSPQHSI